jgi:hypothetical protein
MGEGDGVFDLADITSSCYLLDGSNREFHIFEKTPYLWAYHGCCRGKKGACQLEE